MKTILLIILIFFYVQLSKAQWQQVSNGMPGASVRSLVYSGNYIFAGTGNGVSLSTNNCITWTQTSLNNQTIEALAINGNNIFAGAYATGVKISTDNGTTWTQTSFNNRSVWTLAINGSYVFAGTDPDGVYLSTNNGLTWTQTSL